MKRILIVLLVVAGLCACVSEERERQIDESRARKASQDSVFENLPQLNIVPVAQTDYRYDEYFLFDLPSEGKRCLAAESFRGGGVHCWDKK